jgi:uncharacterized protein YndB with AHSA1/START domain
MGGTKTTLEYEINASRRMLYPYISTASGLAQWFAEDVSVDEDKNFHFIWDGEVHKAKMAAHRTNNFVKFEFLNDMIDEEHAYTEIRLEQNELTQAVFLRVIDYSDIEDEEEVHELWDNIIHELKEIVGG